jgi:hypothetical protein
MTMTLLTALRAAETLAAFHRERAENTAAPARSFHEDMAWRCADDAKRITRAILAGGVTVENQAAAMRRRDLDTAHKIISRHPIMHGVGMPVEDVAPGPDGDGGRHCGRAGRGAGRTAGSMI